MTADRQTTLSNPAILSGVGVHSGLPVTLELFPAEAGSGITFIRTGLEGRPDQTLRADFRAVTATEFALVLGDRTGPILSSAEHVLAALGGLGIDNATIRANGPEMPIMDGSAEPIVKAIDQAGITTLKAPRRYIEVLKPIRIAFENARGELKPYAHGLRIDVDIDFDHSLIGRQSYGLHVEPKIFRRELAPARTFGFMRDVTRLWSAGYALGASLENTLVFTDNKVLNPEGPRFSDECARHKALDALGDFAMAGAPILGAYHSVRGGHKLNYAILCALMTDHAAWKMTEKGANLAPTI